MKFNHSFFIILVILCFACKQTVAPNVTLHNTSSAPITIFKASNTKYPNISVHRGGKGLKNYPENCLETLQYINDSITAIFEVDVAQTKDGKLILMHDNAIDRTTTGSGLVKNTTYKTLRSFNLVDDFGNETQYKVPLFSDVLKWCKANAAILTIDIKQSVSVANVISEIKRLKAEDISIIITYNLAQAENAYALAPNLLLSVSARNDKELDNLLASKVPTKNMLAFTGTRLSQPTLFKRLHAQNIVCMLGTLGNLDNRAKAKGDTLYKQWKAAGIDILATDRPFAAYNSINN